jgi:predicted metalloprotease with PDZ domain
MPPCPRPLSLTIATVRSATLTVSLLAAMALVARAQTPEEVTYHLRYAEPGARHVEVTLSWSPPLTEPRALVMPRAIPMGYGEQRYDAFVEDVRAGGPDNRWQPAARDEGPRWRLAAGTTRVAYRVDVGRLERDITSASDQSRIRDGYVGLLGYSVLAFVDGFEPRPTLLRVEGPAGWPVFSTLAPRWPVTTALVEARTDDFYALADGQIVMGPRADIRRLTTTPAPLYLASYAEGPVDLDRVARLAVTAFERVTAYFGSAPFPHYTMHQELLTPISPRHEYGMSMEHLGSSTYYLSAAAGLTAASTPDDDARVLYNFAHHIAHAWVPKRAYGHGYFPFQWELAPVLDTIWFAEGFGQYAAIMAVAAGTDDPAAFREGMLNRRFRANVASAPAFLSRMTLTELSRVASTRYSEDFRTGRLVFSRGGLLAAALDDHIQAGSGKTHSLRDALRHLVAWTAREQRAFTPEELPRLIEEATGVDTRAVLAAGLK